jgi:hypothetical protein
LHGCRPAVCLREAMGSQKLGRLGYRQRKLVHGNTSISIIAFAK